MAEEELRFDGKLCIIIFRYLFRNNDAAQVDVYVFSCFLFSPHFLRLGSDNELLPIPKKRASRDMNATW